MSLEIARGLTALEQFRLLPGNHESAADGLCAMEAVAWLAGLPHSDRPACTSEILAGYVRHLNDHMPDDERHRLVAFLPDLIGTAAPELDHVLNEYLAWQAIHLFAPAALRADDLEEEAEQLEAENRSLYYARETADAIMKRWSFTSDEPAAGWAVLRAHKAAGLAPYFFDQRNDFFHGVWGDTTYDSCARAAAGSAFQAHRASCAEAWDLALFVLDEALTIVQNR